MYPAYVASIRTQSTSILVYGMPQSRGTTQYSDYAMPKLLGMPQYLRVHYTQSTVGVVLYCSLYCNYLRNVYYE